MYVVETRFGSIKIREQLQMSEMCVLCKVTNDTLRDLERNEHIRQICKVEPVSERVPSRTWEYDAHADTMGDDRIVKILRDNRPVGRRAVTGSKTH